MSELDSLCLVDPVTWSSLLPLYNRSEDYVARITIKTQIYNIKNHPDFPVNLYAVYDDPEEGLVFKWKINDYRYEVMIFSIKDDLSKLTSALLSSKNIDWNVKLTFCSMTLKVKAAVENVRDIKAYSNKIYTDTIAKLTKDKALLLNIILPSDIRLDIIGTEYAEEIDNAWPHRYPGSLNYFKDMLNRKSAIGLWGKTDWELRGWILRSLRGDLHALFIKKEHRRKGYGRLLVEVLSKNIAEQDNEVYGCIVLQNVASKKLFSKLGFDLSESVYWLDE